MIPIRIAINDRGAGGLPGAFLFNLAERITSYAHAISDQYGFETMDVTLICDYDDALDWLSNGLMREAIASGPNAATIWQGFCNSVDLQLGQETRSLSLDSMANHVVCKYTLADNTPGVTGGVSDPDSLALYGRKDIVVSLGTTTAVGAGNLASQALRTVRRPRTSGGSKVASGSLGQISVTLHFVGWYALLGWQTMSNPATTISTTTGQIGALLAPVPLLAVTGILVFTATDTVFIEPNTPIVQKLEGLLSQGDGSGNAVAWGVYEDYYLWLELGADATPTVIAYYRSIGECVVRDSSGGMVNWWDVRPNRMYAVRELMDVNLSDVAPDAGGVSYLSRVSCSISHDSIELDLEGRTGDSIDRIVARVR